MITSLFVLSDFIKPVAAAETLPTACGNLYAFSLTNATISYGGQSYNPIMDPNETITMAYGAYYQISFQGFTAPRSNSSNTRSGTLWYATTAAGPTEMDCTAGGYLANTNYVVTNYDSTGLSIGPQGGLQTVTYLFFGGCYNDHCGLYSYVNPTIWFKVNWLPDNYTGHTTTTTVTSTTSSISTAPTVTTTVTSTPPAITKTVTNTSISTSTVTSISTATMTSITTTATTATTTKPSTAMTTTTDTVTSTAIKTTTVTAGSTSTTSAKSSVPGPDSTRIGIYALGVVAAVMGLFVAGVTVMQKRREAEYKKASSSPSSS